jgi:hypothetical protein
VKKEKARSAQLVLVDAHYVLDADRDLLGLASYQLLSWVQTVELNELAAHHLRLTESKNISPW